MWVRTQLKIGWLDLLAGAWNCFKSNDRAALQRSVESFFSDSDDTIVTYSVRSGFDLLIQALDLKPGDEVIFSALNVKGMVRVVRDAGLVPVPVDLDFSSMGPSLEKLEKAITPRSRVFVAAHLFGTRLDLDPVFALVRSKGIVAVEDCAQAFNGRAYPGSRAADLNMFSFGPIKTSTALGGALIRVRDDKVRGRMRAIQAAYPIQPDSKQLKRVFQFMGLKLITSRAVLGAIYRYYHSRGQDYEDSLADRVRDVAPLKTAKNLRFQPSTAMLALLNRRLEEFDIQAIRVRTNKGEKLRDMIGSAVAMPAQANTHHDYWVFPLIVDEPRKFIDGLRAEGFDAADLPRSQHIAAPKDRPELEPKTAAGVMRDLVVIPCYDTMPDEELARQAQVIKRLAGELAPSKA
ncbi:DegT/DnrJ/EryC1/StrS family aminotransferase [Taklimakanibacter deserti]|uniref:DegT/DnrJ/EryC1/StrS family aminotransferase n=1 Tax=Taklimakanibacter deserti TaxID=2267839 RepID=UPI000E6465EC